MQASSPAEWSGEVSDVQQHVQEPRWSPRVVFMQAGVKHLDAPLLPFAVLKDDPCLNFYAQREARRLYTSVEHAAEIAEELWNQPFNTLAQTQRYFLIAWGAVPHASPHIAPVAELVFGIATPGPYYKRWITTSAVSYQGEPVAWCIEINMLGAQNNSIEIALTEENMLRLLPGKTGRNIRVT